MTNAPVELSAPREESTSHRGAVTANRAGSGLAEARRAAAWSLPLHGSFVQLPSSAAPCASLEPWLQDALMTLQRTRLSEPLPARFHEPLYELQRLLGWASRTRR